MPDIHKPYALIVEDDASVSEFFAMVFEFEEFQTQIARNGKTALALLREQEPHLILLDMGLPDMNGRQILEYIHQEPRLAHTWIVVATGESHYISNQSDDLIDFGFTKPIDAQHLQQIALRLKQHPKATIPS